QSAAVLAFLDNAVIRPRSDQQADGADEEPQANRVRVAGISRELIESVVEHPPKAESEQDLGAENQDPGFLEGDLDLFRQLHARINTDDATGEGNPSKFFDATRSLAAAWPRA